MLACAIGAWILAIIGWRRARRERRLVWPLLLPVFYLNIVLALLLALGRYSAPILPALLVVSAFGVDTLLDRWRSASCLTCSSIAIRAVLFDVDGTLYRQGPVRRAMVARLAGAYWRRPGEGAAWHALLGAYRRAQEDLRGSRVRG